MIPSAPPAAQFIVISSCSSQIFFRAGIPCWFHDSDYHWGNGRPMQFFLLYRWFSQRQKPPFSAMSHPIDANVGGSFLSSCWGTLEICEISSCLYCWPHWPICFLFKPQRCIAFRSFILETSHICWNFTACLRWWNSNFEWAEQSTSLICNYRLVQSCGSSIHRNPCTCRWFIPYPMRMPWEPHENATVS